MSINYLISISFLVPHISYIFARGLTTWLCYYTSFTIFLIYVGAIVRATGSGLGCPDWPKCWGELIPPTSLDQVDFDKLNIEKFQKKNPSITRESLAAEFNPVHVWVEFINRLVSLPVGLFTLSTFLDS